MDGIKTNKFIYLFLLIIVGIILFPNNVMAKDTLIECNYQNEEKASIYRLIIYDDYSVKGEFVTFDGKKVKNRQNNKFNNWSSLLDTAKSKEGSDKCPKYAILRKRVGDGLLNGTFISAYDAWGYYDKETLKTAAEKIVKNDKKFLNVMFNVATGGVQTHLAELYKVKDTTGKSSLVDNNNTTNNSSSNNQDESLVGNENYSKCKDFLGDPMNSKSVAWLLQKLFNYVKVLGPILVILFSTIDFTKTILNSDEEAMKKQQKRLGIRLMCAIGIYFLPIVVTLIINLIFGTADANAVCGIK